MFLLLLTLAIATMCEPNPVPAPTTETVPTTTSTLPAPLTVPPYEFPQLEPCPGADWQVLVEWDWAGGCDMVPPRLLSLWAPIPADISWHKADCDHSGGRFLADTTTGRVYCVGIDY